MTAANRLSAGPTHLPDPASRSLPRSFVRTMFNGLDTRIQMATKNLELPAISNLDRRYAIVDKRKLR